MWAARGVEVLAIQLGKVDLASSAGKIMLPMLAAVTETTRDLLVERTQAGLAPAKAQGRQLGRSRKKSERERADIVREHHRGATINALGLEYGSSRASVQAIAKPDRAG